MSQLTKTISERSTRSTESFDSLEFDFDEEETYNNAPHDIYYVDSESGDRLLVLRKGDPLPVDSTKYKKKKEWSYALKFSVSDKLVVKMMKRIDRKVPESSSLLGRDGATVAGDSGDDTDKYGEDVSLVEGSPVIAKKSRPPAPSTNSDGEGRGYGGDRVYGAGGRNDREGGRDVRGYGGGRDRDVGGGRDRNDSRDQRRTRSRSDSRGRRERSSPRRERSTERKDRSSERKDISSKKAKRSENALKSQEDWLEHLSDNLPQIVAEGLEASRRECILKKIKERTKLSPKENSAVLHSINFAIMNQIGRRRPSPEFCRRVEAIMKREVPDTYAAVEKVETQFGQMPVQRKKGEGGAGSLAKRIADNFYNKYIREEITQPTSSSSKRRAPVLMDFSGGKKTRKFYSIVPDNWNLALKIESEKYKESEQAYLGINGEDELEVKKEGLAASREYLQIKFRTLEVGAHIYAHRTFWDMLHGPLLLSAWFEWITGGSEEGWLEATIEKNLDAVLKVVAEIISDKKGELWDEKLKEILNNASVNIGNETPVSVFLLRECSKINREKPHRVIFIEGEDDIKDISKQPYIHIGKIPQPEEDYDEKIVVSVMAGSTIVFQDIGFSAALASVIEICFIFNQCYDKEADNTLNFIQRTLGGFGDLEGARNEKGRVKSSFVNFQAEFGRIMVERKLGLVKTFFT